MRPYPQPRPARALMLIVVAMFCLAHSDARAETPAVTMRAGSHAGFGRIVFSLPEPRNVTVEQDGQRVTLRFAEPVPITLRAARNPARNVLSVTEAGGAVMIELVPGAVLRQFRLGNRIVFDAHDAAAGAVVAGTQAARPSLTPAPPAPPPVLLAVPAAATPTPRATAPAPLAEIPTEPRAEVPAVQPAATPPPPATPPAALAEIRPVPRAEAQPERPAATPAHPAAPIFAPPSAAGEGDQVNITLVAIEGAHEADCTTHLGRIAERAQVLSNATSPPFGLGPSLRTFHDGVHRLNPGGELRSYEQLSHTYPIGYLPSSEALRATFITFVRVEVSRVAGTPTGAPSQIAVAWAWLQRLTETQDAATGRVVAQPRMHRFDFSGPLVTRHGTWGRATAACQPGGDGAWFGAVAVWTYLPP